MANVRCHLLTKNLLASKANLKVHPLFENQLRPPAKTFPTRGTNSTGMVDAMIKLNDYGGVFL